MHRIKSDEIFHFYLGCAVTQLHLYPDGTSKIITLGPDIPNGQQPQIVVPANTWQGSILTAGDFALMGTTVTPGFEFEDFELGKETELLEKYPDRKDLIVKLTD